MVDEGLIRAGRAAYRRAFGVGLWKKGRAPREERGAPLRFLGVLPRPRSIDAEACEAPPGMRIGGAAPEVAGVALSVAVPAGRYVSSLRLSLEAMMMVQIEYAPTKPCLGRFNKALLTIQNEPIG